MMNTFNTTQLNQEIQMHTLNISCCIFCGKISLNEYTKITSGPCYS